ncbi:S8 family peptidase [Natronosalvus vescus]|uniref:S8 family peptidase n=1 Tax=Natronosalvus vescus TaxID=2953881 RepID=UPI0020903F92|nr:S8 family peptidase [Natronosalvus vescus]
MLESSAHAILVMVMALLMVTSIMVPAVAAGSSPAADGASDPLESAGTPLDTALNTERERSHADTDHDQSNDADTEDVSAVSEGDTASGTDHEITLITGQTIHVSEQADGGLTVHTSSNDVLHQVDTPDGTYVYPESVDLSVYDRELFNVDRLIDEGMTDADAETIPVIIRASEHSDEVRMSDVGAFDAVEGYAATRSLTLVDATAGEIQKDRSARTLRTLEREFELESVSLDRTVDVATDTSVDAIAGETARETHDVNGTGVTVAVLDTGVDTDHPDLANAVVDQADFTGDGTGDVNGHGTHVAGTIAGDGTASNGTFVGVAPGASIVDVKVLGDAGSGSTSGIIEGIEYAIDEDVDVISMSLGGPGAPDDPLVEAVHGAVDEDITVVVAAGNTGPDQSTIDVPGKAEHVITVGATDHREDDVAGFSSRGPTATELALKPDIAAPGVEIGAARADGAYDPIADYPEYARISGTSMATPHVSGVAAMMLEQNPDKTPDRVKDVLLSNADVVSGTDDAYAVGAGQVNATRAVSPDLVVSNATESFGTVSGDDQVTRTLAVENPTDETVELAVDDHLLETTGGTTHAELVTVNRTSLTLDPGDVGYVEYTIDATAGGIFSGHVEFTNNATAETHRAVFGFAVGDEVTVEKSPYSADGSVEGDEVWVFSLERGSSQTLTVENGQVSFIRTGEEYQLWSSGYDEPTNTPIKTATALNASDATTAILDEQATVAYTIDDSELNASLRSMQVQPKMQHHTDHGDRLSSRSLYDNIDAQTVRFPKGAEYNASVHHVTVSTDQHDGGNNVDVDDVYWLVYGTVGVDGDQKFVVNESELGTFERTYLRSAENERIAPFFNSQTTVWEDYGSGSTSFDVRDRTEQRIHVTQEAIYLSNGVVHDGSLSSQSLTPPEPGGVHQIDFNRHPYTGTFDGFIIEDWRIDLYGGYLSDQNTPRHVYRNWDHGSSYVVTVDGTTIDEGTEHNHHFDSINDIELESGQEVSVELVGENPTGVLSTQVTTDAHVTYEEYGDNTPPLLQHVDVNGLDEYNSVESSEVTITLVVESSDGLAEDDLALLTATEDVDDPAFTDATVNPAGTWDTWDLEIVDTDGQSYLLEATVNATDEEGTLHLATRLVDVEGDRYETTVRDAFHVGDPPSFDDGDSGEDEPDEVRDQTITGQFIQADGDPGVNHTVIVNRRDDGSFLYADAETNATGHFEIDVASGYVYDLTYVQWSAFSDGEVEMPRDGNVDVKSIASVDLTDEEAESTATEPTATDTVSGLTATSGSDGSATIIDTNETELGTIELPIGHVLTVDAKDESGNLVENATKFVSDGAPEEFMGIGINLDTLGEEPGLEMNGSTTVTVSPPENDDRFVDQEYELEFNVTEDTHAEVVLEERETVTLTGQVLLADGTPAANDQIHIPDPNGFQHVATDADGYFSTNVTSNSTLSLGYYQAAENDSFAPVRDGSPDVYSLDRIEVGDEDTDVGTYHLPDASVLDVEVVDKDGQPVENAQVRVVAYNENRSNGFGTGFEPSTNADGWLDFESADDTGIEVTGEVTVQVKPPENDDRFDTYTYEQEVTVEEDTSLQFELAEDAPEQPDTITGQLTLADGTPAANNTLLVNKRNDRWFYDQVETNETGHFEVPIESGAVYDLVYVQFLDDDGSDTDVLIPRDGNVDLYNVASIDLRDGGEETSSGPLTLDPGVEGMTTTTASASGVSSAIINTDDPALGEIELPKGHPVTVEVIDEAGNPVENATATYTDGAPEEFMATGLVGFTENDGLAYWNDAPHPGLEMNGSATVMVEPPEGDSRFVNTTYEFTPSVTEGTNITIELEERDRPTIAIQEPADGSTVNESAVAILYELAHTNVDDAAAVEYRILDDGEAVVDWIDAPFEATGESVTLDTITPELEDGSYELEMRVLDSAGDVIEVSSAVDNSALEVYTTAPVITLISPDEGEHPYESVLDFDVDVAQERTVTVEYRTDTDVTDFTELESPYELDVLGEAWTEGPTTVTIRATDDLGNVAEETFTFEFVSLPSIDAVSPADGALINETAPTIVVEYSDNDVPGDTGVDPDSVTLDVDGEPVDLTEATTLTDTHLEVTLSDLDLDEPQNSTHTFTVTAADQAGYTATETWNVTVDAEAPEVDLDAQPANEAYPNVSMANPAVITVSSDDVNHESTTVEVRNAADEVVFPKDVSDKTGAGSSHEFEWLPIDTSQERLPSGEYTVVLTSTDAAGNIGTASTTIAVDTDDPVIDLIAVDGGELSDDETTRYANGTLNVTVDATDGTADSGDVEDVEVTLESTFTNYRQIVGAEPVTGEPNRWQVALDAATLPDEGEYELRVNAIDAGLNEAELVADETLVYDETPPRLSTVLHLDEESDDGTVVVRANEPLASAPTVVVEHPDGTEETVAVTEDGENRWIGTITATDDGTYRVEATGADYAGNVGVDTATTTVEYVATENRTVTVYNEDTGTVIQFNTTDDVTNSFVTVSESDVPPADLEEDLFGVGFLTTQLGTELETELTNATIYIPVDESHLPDGVDPEAVSITHYNESTETWEERPTEIHDLDDETRSGTYWVTTVEHFSTYGTVIADEQPPSLLDLSHGQEATVAWNTDTLDVTFEYADALSGVDASAIEVDVDDVSVTDDDATQITSSTTTHTLEPEIGQTTTVTVTVFDNAGNSDTFEQSVTVAEPPAPVVTSIDPVDGTEFDPGIEMVDIAFDVATDGMAIDASESTLLVNGDSVAMTIDDGTVSAAIPVADDEDYDVELTLVDEWGHTVSEPLAFSVAAEETGSSPPPLPPIGGGDDPVDDPFVFQYEPSAHGVVVIGSDATAGETDLTTFQDVTSDSVSLISFEGESAVTQSTFDVAVEFDTADTSSIDGTAVETIAIDDEDNALEWMTLTFAVDETALPAGMTADDGVLYYQPHGEEQWHTATFDQSDSTFTVTLKESGTLAVVVPAEDDEETKPDEDSDESTEPDDDTDDGTDPDDDTDDGTDPDDDTDDDEVPSESPDDDDSSSDGLPGFGFTLAISVLLSFALIRTRWRN